MASDDIQGKITDENGDPLSGVKVWLFSQDNPNEVVETTTDSNGDYIFERHPDGDGTSQNWHVTTAVESGSQRFNTFSKPYVSSQIPTTIPDSEGFEHNDLTGVYGGDTGVFTIQQNEVTEGTFALESDADGQNNLIVRDSPSTFDRSGLRIVFDFRLPSSGAGGGIAFATDVSGFSSMNGYDFFASGGSYVIARMDNGSETDLVSGPSPTQGVWLTDCVWEFQADGTIELTVDGNTISVEDTTYQNLRLGFQCFRKAFFDNIRFEEI